MSIAWPITLLAIAALNCMNLLAYKHQVADSALDGYSFVRQILLKTYFRQKNHYLCRLDQFRNKQHIFNLLHHFYFHKLCKSISIWEFLHLFYKSYFDFKLAELIASHLYYFLLFEVSAMNFKLLIYIFII